MSMFNRRGESRLDCASMYSGVVRFFARDGKGRFSSTKVSFIPKQLNMRPRSVVGTMLYVNNKGFIVAVQADREVSLNQINLQSVKVVS